MGKTITFLSTRRRNINVDLMTLKIGLKKRIKDLDFQYYIKPVNDKNRYIQQNLYQARDYILDQYASDIICMDLSMPERMKTKPKGKHILLFAPFEYQFEDYYNKVDGNKKTDNNTLMNEFTHIISGSPFGKRMLEETYGIEKEKIVDGVCFPLATNMNNPKKCKEIREKTERFFSDAKGKKIVALLISGSNKNKTSSFKNFDLKKLLDTFGDDYYFIISNNELKNKAAKLPYRYHTSIGALHEKILKNELLYVSDIMITNESRYLATFAAVEKPVYYYDYNGRCCGRYMKEHFPDVYVEKANDLFEIMARDFSSICKEQETFRKEFSYEANEKIYDVISQILEL